MNRRPSYLRVVVTESCTMTCRYCHAEGLKLSPDLFEEEVQGRALETNLLPIGMGQAGMAKKSTAGGRLSLEEWKLWLQAALVSGVKKLKFLGGEPLVMRSLPELIAFVKTFAPETDVSLITAGAAPVERLEACFSAGLDRANLSIHGFGLEAFRRNAKPDQAERLYAMRQVILERLILRGRPLKLNYVYTGPEVESDLNDLLSWASTKPVVVSVLDDLNRQDFNPDTIRALLLRLRGPALAIGGQEDPHSLPTELWTWQDGLRIEIKSSRLGEVAPWGACTGCPRKPICREGIFALRLDPDGLLRGCADRPDRAVKLSISAAGGQATPADRWEQALASIDQPRPRKLESVTALSQHFCV